MKIVLDNIEEKIKGLLLQYSKEFAKNGNPELTLRFTGGWVRDKLLNRTCHDIDVAIDKTTGEVFANGLHKFLSERDMVETGVHKIAINPQKSKHLETATTRICGLDIDFVNLRSEEYADSDSRIPTTIQFGTPKQDAFRRDATVNALFYNLSTDSVEDFTGKGLDDMHAKILRTPLEPVHTFRDDPLRVLRLLRFVGQLGFAIEQKTLEAMDGDKIGDRLATKVSGERVGVEMKKLVESEYAPKALAYFIDSGLGPFVFRVPETNIAADTALLRKRFDSLNFIFNSEYKDLIPADKSDRGLLWLCVLLQDLNTGDQVSLIIQNGLKLTRAIKDGCQKIVNSVKDFDQLFEKANKGTATRADMGHFVRSLGVYWKLGLTFNSSRVYLEQGVTGVQQVEKLLNDIIKNGVDEAYNLKPLVAGKELMSLLGRKPGPWMQKALADEINYLLENPNSTKDDVVKWAKEHVA